MEFQRHVDFHEVLGFGELFDDQKFTIQGAPEIYPASLISASLFGMMDSFFENMSNEDKQVLGHEDDEEEIDVETVDDDPNASVRASLAAEKSCSISDSMDNAAHIDVPDLLFGLDEFLAGIDKIEAEDLESLLDQFEDAQSYKGPFSEDKTNVPSSLPPTFQFFEEARPPANFVQPSVLSSSENVMNLEGTASDLTGDSIINDVLELNANYFDQISDHNYCQSVPKVDNVNFKEGAGIDLGHGAGHTGDLQFAIAAQDITLDSASTCVQAATSCVSVDSGFCPMSITARRCKSERATSLLRSSTTAHSQLPDSRGQLPASVKQSNCVSATLERHAHPVTGGSKAATSLSSPSSSCSDSGSDCEQSSRRQHSSRRRYRRRSSSGSSDGHSSDSRRRPRSTSYCSSRSKSRSRSRSRSRTSSKSGRWDSQRRKENDKNVAMAERRVVYVGGIPRNFTKVDLRRRFSGFGEIEDVGVHFRDWGDNYGFVTFSYSCDAYAAVEKGNDVPGRKFDLCFGGRRQFCDSEYADLDGCAAIKEEWALRSCRRGDDFDSLLKQTIRSLKKK